MSSIGFQAWVSAWQLQLLWGHPRSRNRSPRFQGDHKMEMETRFSAHLRSGVTCIALSDVPETMGCHRRKVWH